MSTEPTEGQSHTNQMKSSGQDKSYTAEKLRGAAVMYAPSILRDLLEGISVLAAAFGKLPYPQRKTAARIVRPIVAVGALLPWVYLLIVRPWHLRWGSCSSGWKQS